MSTNDLTVGNDNEVKTSGPALINGLDGNDIIRCSNGADTINGGNDDDILVWDNAEIEVEHTNELAKKNGKVIDRQIETYSGANGFDVIYDGKRAKRIGWKSKESESTYIHVAELAEDAGSFAFSAGFGVSSVETTINKFAFYKGNKDVMIYTALSSIELDNKWGKDVTVSLPNTETLT